MSVLGEIKSKKHKRKSNKIVFDSEVITKDVAEKLIEDVNVNQKLNKRPKKKRQSDDTVRTEYSKEIHQESIVLPKKKPKQKRNKELNDSNNDTSNKHSSKKESPTNIVDGNVSDSTGSETDISNVNNTSTKKEESIRAGKRRRHLELLQENKLRTEINLQQKCLNYLSRWKHNKAEWKFEKLKQVWLQQNLFDDTKVPDEFWNTIIEYFNSAKGQVKSNILKDAVKIVDSAENLADESPEKANAKYIRARDIIQNIQA